MNLSIGESRQLTATVTPADATNKTVTFASSDDTVAIVGTPVYDSETGKTSVTVTAVRAGTATITAATVIGNIIATCDARVLPSHSQDDDDDNPTGGSTTPSNTTSQSSSFTSNTPTGDVPPANIANKPLKGTVVGTPKEALDNAEKAFKQNSDMVQTSSPVTLAAPPKTNSGLTPVSVPIPAGTKFTALVSPNADGTFTPVPTYTDKNGTVYALIDEQKTLIPVTVNTVFNDVSANNWFAESAKAASEWGIIFGYGDSTFRPDITVTNQQTVSMLMRTVGFNADYNNVMKTAEAKGIKSASGLDNADFTSRAVTAVLIKDILASVNVNVSLKEEEKARLLAPFSDLKGMTEEETLSIAVAIKYGILVGTYTGKDYSIMSPDMLLTRAQMATISTRLVKFLTE